MGIDTCIDYRLILYSLIWRCSATWRVFEGWIFLRNRSHMYRKWTTKRKQIAIISFHDFQTILNSLDFPLLLLWFCCYILLVICRDFNRTDTAHNFRALFFFHWSMWMNLLGIGDFFVNIFYKSHRSAIRIARCRTKTQLSTPFSFIQLRWRFDSDIAAASCILVQMARDTWIENLICSWLPPWLGILSKHK